MLPLEYAGEPTTGELGEPTEPKTGLPPFELPFELSLVGWLISITMIKPPAKRQHTATATMGISHFIFGTSHNPMQTLDLTLASSYPASELKKR
jgi:hypothetical protein